MSPRDLLILLIELGVVGFIVYLIITYIPMPEVFKQVIIVIVVIAMLLFVISYLPGLR